MADTDEKNLAEEKGKEFEAGHGSPPEYANGHERSYYPPSQRPAYDKTVTFEEYTYYAKITREEQKEYKSPPLQWRTLLSGSAPVPETDASDIKGSGTAAVDISDEEWNNASRAARTAGWGAIFYLITTDILGPFAVPFSIGTLGYGPGVGVFTAFAILGAYCGYLIWKVYMGVDSHEFPARNYGDLAFRAWGPIARYIVNILQATALLLLLGQVTLLFGQNISQMSRFNLCYVVCPLIFVLVGFFLTQIRTLRNFGWVANFGFWLNILSIFISMGATARDPPNYNIAALGSVGSFIDEASITPDANGNWPPVMASGSLPSNNLVGTVNGILSGVLAWAGLQLFTEFIAEMRRPHDFLKGMFVAQFVIYTCYVVYGCFMYYYQGQYTYNPAYLGVSDYGWQTAGNTLTLLSGLVAAGLYGNIGIKVFYNNIFVDLFHAPLLTSKGGKIFYAAIVPIWWSIAFVIAAAIPAYVAFVSIISATCLLPLTFIIPPWLSLGYDIRRHTIGTFDPAIGRSSRQLTGIPRYIRGFFAGGILQVAINIWHTLFVLTALSLCGLGTWGAIEGFINAFQTPQFNSFNCTSPLNLGLYNATS